MLLDHFYNMDLSDKNVLTLLDLKKLKIEEKANETSYSFSGKEVNMINCSFQSDDFELNKKKRGAKSYWIKTITLSPTVHNFASKSHTCLLAAGHKGENRDSINKMTFDELSTLSNGIIHLNKQAKSLELFSLHVV